MSESGESTTSIIRRGDDEAWPAVRSALEAGGWLRVHHRIERAAVEGLAEKDLRSGRTISSTRVRRLEREGVLERCGVDVYTLNKP